MTDGFGKTRGTGMSSFKRADRVADLIKMEIADLLLKQVRDPRIGSVTITGVKVTDDLRTARVFFVEMGKDTCSAGGPDGSREGDGFSEEGTRPQAPAPPRARAPVYL